MIDGTDLFNTMTYGYRLQRVEISNWGTFDSKSGGVHVLDLGGRDALLVGQNGAGKSTVVDAILTLLVRPGSRNYNVAAGGKQRERDERSYIRGACGRNGRDDESTAEVRYLRAPGQHLSVLLAAFANSEGGVFTIAQVLYAGNDGDVTKIYAFARRDMSIADNLSGFATTEKLRQQVEKRGFRATMSYSDFHTWLCEHTGLRSKATEMFNQTVALKDIRSLNAFIRDHMLEPGAWERRIEDLQKHFQELTEAHSSLVRVKKQAEMLSPIREQGTRYLEWASALRDLTAVSDAVEFYFLSLAVDLGEPKLDGLRTRIADLSERASQLASLKQEADDQIRRLTNEIETAGGQRARDIPREIDLERERAKGKRDAAARVQNELKRLGQELVTWSREAWDRVRQGLDGLRAALETEQTAVQTRRDNAVSSRGELRRQLRDLEEELASLRRRRGSIPRHLDEGRRRICSDLSIAAEELPFAAELVDVKDGEREWQPSIEIVLGGFARTILVPRRHYGVVSRYVDGRRLTDDAGNGIRLHYEVVNEGGRPEARQVSPQSMISKLVFREEHPLWTAVKAAIESRLDHRCFDSIEEWQRFDGNAITKNRHIKTKGRHQKDDRDQSTRAGNFVLGWDNRAKLLSITAEMEELRKRVGLLDGEISRADAALQHYPVRLSAVSALQSVSAFSEIDPMPHEARVSALEEERRRLLEGNDNLRRLKSEKETAEQRSRELDVQRAQAFEERGGLVQEEKRISVHLDIARSRLAESERSGSLAGHRERFPAVAAQAENSDLTFERVDEARAVTQRRIGKLIDEAREQLDSLSSSLHAAMARFLREFKELEEDLRPELDHLKSFLALERRITEDDLPRFADRFRTRLNSTMLDEVGLLSLDFTAAGNEIRTRVEQLNVALGQLEYRPGTRMVLVCRPVIDREIADFRQQLRDCTSNSFERTPEADEDRYGKIASLLGKLGEDSNWRARVTDVRRWFDFAAREVRKEDDSEVNYFQDGQGQSGGEKAKLAFTILVSALAYQYDIDPERPRADRFNFVVVDEMFSKVDDQYSRYAMGLFRKFNLQLLVVAPLDAKARVTEDYVGCYLHVVKDPDTSTSEVFHMTAEEFMAVAARDGNLAGAEPSP